MQDARFSSIVHAKAEYIKMGFIDDMPPEFDLMVACLPQKGGYEEALDWLADFFEKTCDKAPNAENHCQLPGVYSKRKIYELLVAALKVRSEEFAIIKYHGFKKIWKRCFPNVKITQWLNVNGKCEQCEHIYEREAVFKTAREREEIAFLKQFHRGMISKARGTYYKNRVLAYLFPETYCSIIMDGMQQGHCALPHRANQKEYPEKTKQHIEGIKNHGRRRALYRTFQHIKGGSNPAVHCLNQEVRDMLSDCIKNGKPVPSILLLQIDGGPENACKTFYAACDLLTRIGLFQKVQVSRLPVGHTHEDIDAMFGTIWTALQTEVIKSPQEWKRKAMAAFDVREGRKIFAEDDSYF